MLPDRLLQSGANTTSSRPPLPPLPQMHGVRHPNSLYMKSRDVNNTVNVCGLYLDYQCTSRSLMPTNRVVVLVNHYVATIKESV